MPRRLLSRPRAGLAALLLLMAAWWGYQIKSALGINLIKHGGLHIDLASLKHQFLRSSEASAKGRLAPL